MKFNALIPSNNAMVVSELIKTTGGKLIISSINAFVLSAIIDVLKNIIKSGEHINLFTGNKQVNEDKEEDNKVIVVNSNDIGKLHKELIDDSYYVAMLTETKNSKFEFNISVNKVSEYLTSNTEDKGVQGSVPMASISTVNRKSKSDIEKEIIKAIRSNNIIFIQDINEKVTDIIKANTASSLVVDSYEAYHLYEVEDTNRSECLIVKVPFPKDISEATQCKISTEKYLSYFSKIICDTSWIGMFLELSSNSDNVDFTATVVYNNNHCGVNPNDSVFADYLKN